MKTIGRTLYEIYANVQLTDNNCSVDEWEELSEADRHAYELTAQQFSCAGNSKYVQAEP